MTEPPSSPFPDRMTLEKIIAKLREDANLGKIIRPEPWAMKMLLAEIDRLEAENEVPPTEWKTLWYAAKGMLEAYAEHLNCRRCNAAFDTLMTAIEVTSDKVES